MKFAPSICNGECDRFDVKSGGDVTLQKSDTEGGRLRFRDIHGDDEIDGRVDRRSY